MIKKGIFKLTMMTHKVPAACLTAGIFSSKSPILMFQTEQCHILVFKIFDIQTFKIKRILCHSFINIYLVSGRQYSSPSRSKQVLPSTITSLQSLQIPGSCFMRYHPHYQDQHIEQSPSLQYHGMVVNNKIFIKIAV